MRKLEINENDSRKIVLLEDNEENRKKAAKAMEDAVILAEKLKKKYKLK